MDMMEWAKKEIEIACKRENPLRKEGEWDYGCACYESAFKAFKSLMEDGHSGFSISMTKHILNRLIDGKPLTPIEDTDDIWEECSWSKSPGEKIYHCKRMSSLFKTVYQDGSIKYDDVDRYYAVDINNQDISYTNGLVRQIINEMFPITLPYIPTEKKFKVVCEDFLTDSRNGDYDTKAIYYVITPDGEKVDIGRYFKPGTEGFVEINRDEFEARKKMHDDREKILNMTRK